MFQWLIYLIQYIKPTVFPHYHYEYLIVLLLGVSVQVITKNVSIVNFHAFSSLSNLRSELFTTPYLFQAYFTKLQFTISVTFSELWCIIACGLRTLFSKATWTCGSKPTLLVLITNSCASDGPHVKGRLPNAAVVRIKCAVFSSWSGF